MLVTFQPEHTLWWLLLNHREGCIITTSTNIQIGDTVHCTSWCYHCPAVGRFKHTMAASVQVMTNYTFQSINAAPVNIQDASYWRYSFICIGIGSSLIRVFDTCCKMQSRQAFCNVATTNRQHLRPVIPVNWPTVSLTTNMIYFLQYSKQ